MPGYNCNVIAFSNSTPFKGAAGESNSHWAAYGSFKHQASGGCTCLWHAGDRVLPHPFFFQQRTRGRSQQCSRQTSCGHFRAICRTSRGHVVLHCLPLRLGLQGPGRPQQHRAALHHPSWPNDPFRRTRFHLFTGRFVNVAVEQNHSDTASRRHPAAGEIDRYGRDGPDHHTFHSAHAGARRRAFQWRLGVAGKRRVDWKICFKR